MSEEVLKSEKLKEALKNVMTAVEDIPASEIIEGNALFPVISDMGKGSLSVMGKGIDIADVLAMTAIDNSDILKMLKTAVLTAEEYVNKQFTADKIS
jgi:hypothetical protein